MCIMKEKEEVCLLGRHSFNDYRRLYRLSNVEEMLVNTYGHFFLRVNQPYSCQEQDILIRIIRLLSSLLQDEIPKPCVSCKFVKDDIAFWGRREFFRLDLPEEAPFGIPSRLRSMCELENRLICFFINETRSRLYSAREKKVLRRIRKMFIHELRNTTKYDLFKIKHVRHISEEEQLELRYQKTDEIRLKIVPLSKYNPLSQKFKKEKEDFLKDFDAKFGKP